MIQVAQTSEASVQQVFERASAQIERSQKILQKIEHVAEDTKRAIEGSQVNINLAETILQHAQAISSQNPAMLPTA